MSGLRQLWNSPEPAWWQLLEFSGGCAPSGLSVWLLNTEARSHSLLWRNIFYQISSALARVSSKLDWNTFWSSWITICCFLKKSNDLTRIPFQSTYYWGRAAAFISPKPNPRPTLVLIHSEICSGVMNSWDRNERRSFPNPCNCWIPKLPRLAFHVSPFPSVSIPLLWSQGSRTCCMPPCASGHLLL